MNTKEEILNDSPVWLTFHQRKYVLEAMQTYADQEVMKAVNAQIKESNQLWENNYQIMESELAAKDNEISRLNGIITEQARLSELVSGDLQKAQKEIQELREKISELDKLKLDTLINLRIENASLRAKNQELCETTDRALEETYSLRADRADYEKLKDSDKALIFELNTEMIRLRAEVERLNLIVKQLTNPVSIGTYDGAPKPSITTTSDRVDLVQWVVEECDLTRCSDTDAEQMLKEYDALENR